MSTGISRREFLGATAGGLAGTGMLPAWMDQEKRAAEKPNILITMSDQMTVALTCIYGHPVVRTPALARLAAKGVRFDATYTNYPLCTPSRSAMLSGRYASRTRTYDNGAVLSCDVPTFAHYLRAAGYEMVASGKMHMVGADQLHGFERRLTPDIYPADFRWTPSWRSHAERGIRNEKAQLLATRRNRCER